MKLFALAATTSAQIQLFHPDNTAIIIGNDPGCYNIFPAIDEVADTNGFKLEFYKHSNCGGLKINEVIGDNVFKVPVHAFSVKVSENRRRFRYLLADWNDNEDDLKEANEEDFLNNFSEELDNHYMIPQSSEVEDSVHYFDGERDDLESSEYYPQDRDSDFDTNQGIFDFEKNGIDWSLATVEADEDGVVRGVNTAHHNKEQVGTRIEGCNPFTKVFWGC